MEWALWILAISGYVVAIVTAHKVEKLSKRIEQLEKHK